MLRIIEVYVVRLLDSDNSNNHMLALGSHPDYDTQGWGFEADTNPLIEID